MGCYKRASTKSVSTLKGLKNAIKVEWENLKQFIIDNALKYWTKHCRLIYYAHGSSFEHLLQLLLKEKEKKLYFVSK